VRAALPFDALLAGQPQIGLVDERRGVQRVVGPLEAQLFARELAQLVVDERVDACQRVGVAAAGLPQQQRYFGGAARRIASVHEG
jgi:hypothetical protein